MTQDVVGAAVLAALKRSLLGPDELDEARLCTTAGVEPEVARRLWQAMGFVEQPSDAVVYTGADLLALSQINVATSLAGQEIGEEQLVQSTRVLSSLLARAADVVAENMLAELGALRESSLDEEAVATTAVEELKLLDVSALVDYLFRRQLVTAITRQMATVDLTEGGRSGDVAVVFADLVGYTALSQQLDDAELAQLVTRFQSLAYDLVAPSGGRVIKTLGDEVMVVCEDVAAAARIAVQLVGVYAGESLVPDVRVGMAYGPALALQGDYFGPTVNLASRLAGVARPGTVLVADAAYRALEHANVGRWTRLRPRRVKGVGWTTAWRLVPETTASAVA